LSAGEVGWDVTHYVEKLLKKPSKSGMKALDLKESLLRKQYPPLNGEMASTLCIIVDTQGIILSWYLPGILTSSRQVGLLALPDFCQKPDTSQNAMLVV